MYCHSLLYYATAEYQFTSRKLERITTERKRRVNAYFCVLPS